MTNKKSTKRALLLSLLSMLLCITMLVGTTFAWFTDSVTSSGNIIKSGTLEVGMYWAEGQNKVPTDEADWTDAAAGAIFDYDKWEPGYVEARHIKIANEGTLALKYQINVIANGEVSDLADVIDVYYFDPAVDDLSRASLTDANKLGTLTEVLAGMNDTANGALLEGESETITIALMMQTSAGNEYQNKSIGSSFSIQLIATQYTYEEDSFDDQYDKDAIHYDVLVTNAEELYEAVANASKNIVIAVDGNITLTSALSKTGLESIKFVAYDDEATIDQATYNMYFKGANVTFEGLTLTHGEKKYGDGGQASTTFAVWNANSVNYVDCTFTRSVGTLHADTHNFIRCTFYGVENPDNSKSEYPLYICSGKDYNVVDCVFYCTNRGAILFYNDGGDGVDTLNISGTKFLGDIIADKTAVEIHNNSKTQVYNVNIKDVVVGDGIINGLYRIKPANVGEVNVTVDGVANAITVSSSDEFVNALKGMTANSILILEDDVTVTSDWDSRNTGGKKTVPVTIDGMGHTLKMTGTVSDGGNYHSVFRFESDATVKNLTFDMSEAGGYNGKMARAISAKGNLIVDNCTFIGNTALSNARAIIFGEGNKGGTQYDAEVVITNSKFVNFRKGVTDNENGTDIKKVTVSGCTFDNADVYLSAYECATFTDNTMTGSQINVISYTALSTAKVVVTGNVLDSAEDNIIGNVSKLFTAANVTAQDGVIVNVAD